MIIGSDEYYEHIKRLVDAAPPIPEEARRKIAAIFGGQVGEE